MEQILSFVLGISVVLIILGAVLLVKTIKKVEKLESNVKIGVIIIQNISYSNSKWFRIPKRTKMNRIYLQKRKYIYITIRM